MAAEPSVTTAPLAPLWGELRYSTELARLLAGAGLLGRRPRASRRRDAVPVLLIPGFMAGDNSLSVLRRWLRGQGHPVRMSGIPEFDRNCADAIRRASPLPPMPSNLGRATVRIIMSFVATNPIVRSASTSFSPSTTYTSF